MTYKVSTSKFLSYVLRHRPDSIGLVLDKNGWANIDELMSKSTEPLSLEDIIAAVENNDKKRFTLDLENRRIRANQGHSINVDVELKEVIPPPILYHGTVSKFLPAILKEGLKPMTRQHVHLSGDIETAQKVGNRRGNGIILNVHTPELLKNGHKFYLSENGVWLTDFVPSWAISQM